MPATSTLIPPSGGGHAGAPEPVRSPASEQFLAAYPGPALLSDGAGRVVMANAQAGNLQSAIEEGMVPDLALALSRALASGESQTATAILPAHLGGSGLNLTLVAGGVGLVGAKWVLVLGSDASLEINLRNALVESRQRYKDLVDCSSDFAWETGKDGRFVFVSPAGVLGYHPDELIGRAARDFVSADFEPPEELPFDGARRMEDVVVWFRAAGGGNACLTVSSVPLFGPDGAWAGARGVGRDITAGRAKDLLLAVARRREQVLDAVARATRIEVEAPAMLIAASRAVAEAMELSACWVLRLDASRQPYVAASWPPRQPPPASVMSRLAEVVARAAPDAHHALEVDGALLVPAQHAQCVNGAIAALQGPGDWGIEDRDLMSAVAGQVGILIEQASIHEQLQVMSRTDPLTGLLNRRAFLDEAGRRLAHATRTGRGAGVLYIDLNNFKAINDAFGHGAGDRILRTVTRVIADTGRGGDVASRYGGDEFVIWLDETNLAGANARAEKLIALIDKRTDMPEVPGRRFGLAIGVAAFDPASGEQLASLLERADRAMYEAKRARDGFGLEIAPAFAREAGTA